MTPYEWTLKSRAHEMGWWPHDANWMDGKGKGKRPPAFFGPSGQPVIDGPRPKSGGGIPRPKLPPPPPPSTPTDTDPEGFSSGALDPGDFASGSNHFHIE